MDQRSQPAQADGGVPVELIREELGQAIETYRTLWSLFMSTGVGLVAANVALLAFAVSQRLIVPVMFGSLFPLAILFLAIRIPVAMKPVIFSAISLEQRFGGDDEDWLMTTLIAATDPAFLDDLRQIARRATRVERLKEIERLPSPYRLRSPVHRSMLGMAAFELLSPPFLLFAHWRFF